MFGDSSNVGSQLLIRESTEHGDVGSDASTKISHILRVKRQSPPDMSQASFSSQLPVQFPALVQQRVQISQNVALSIYNVFELVCSIDVKRVRDISFDIPEKI